MVVPGSTHSRGSVGGEPFAQHRSAWPPEPHSPLQPHRDFWTPRFTSGGLMSPTVRHPHHISPRRSPAPAAQAATLQDRERSPRGLGPAGGTAESLWLTTALARGRRDDRRAFPKRHQGITSQQAQRSRPFCQRWDKGRDGRKWGLGTCGASVCHASSRRADPPGAPADPSRGLWGFGLWGFPAAPRGPVLDLRHHSWSSQGPR